MANLFHETGEFKPDGLIADTSFPLLTEGVLLAPGQGLLCRGSLLGKAADGNYYLSGKTVADTKVMASRILTDEIDTGGLDATEKKIAIGYTTGCFDVESIVTETGTEASDYKDELEKYGIYLRSVQAY